MSLVQLLLFTCINSILFDYSFAKWSPIGGSSSRIGRNTNNNAFSTWRTHTHMWLTCKVIGVLSILLLNTAFKGYHSKIHK